MSQDLWVEYIMLIATFCGHDMLSKLKLDPLDKSGIADAYHRACVDTLVGHGSMPSLIRAYLQVGDVVPSDPHSVSEQLAHAWGMSCFCDVFVLTLDRYDCKTGLEVHDLLFDRFLPDVKRAFDAARVDCATTASAASLVADCLVEVTRRCSSRSDQAAQHERELLEAEYYEQTRLKQQKEKRRAKKNRRRVRKQQRRDSLTEPELAFEMNEEMDEELVEDVDEPPEDTDDHDRPSADEHPPLVDNRQVAGAECEAASVDLEDDDWSTVAVLDQDDPGGDDDPCDYDARTHPAAGSEESALPIASAESKVAEVYSDFERQLCHSIADLFGPDSPPPAWASKKKNVKFINC